MVRIRQAIPIEKYRLKVTFSSGEEGIFDMKGWLRGPIYSTLKNEDLFNHVAIDEISGTVCWPNGIDICPDMVYEQTKILSTGK